MEGHFTKAVVKWCKDDLSKNLASGFSQIAQQIDGMLNEEYEELKREKQAFAEEKKLWEKDVERKTVEVQKAVESAKEVEVNKKQLAVEKAKVKKDWGELEAAREKLKVEQEGLRKRLDELAEREHKFSSFEASRMKLFESKEAEVMKHEETVKAKEHKLNELRKSFNETKTAFEEGRIQFEEANKIEKENLLKLRAELEDKENQLEYLELDLDLKMGEIKEKCAAGANRRPGEWIPLKVYGSDPALVGDNHGEYDRLRKVTKMMEKNNAVVYIRTDHPTEISVGIKSAAARDVARLTSAKGETDKQCLKELGDELLKRVRTSYGTTGRAPSVSSFRA